MAEISLRANAKVNLTLDITGVRETDGYHLMDMVNISAGLGDDLVLKESRKSGITITSNARFLPRGEKNLAYKAIKRLCDHVGTPLPDLEMHIQKRIPTQAGLGGGSADAAAAMIGVNELLGLGVSQAELVRLGEKVGADVPYCLVGGAHRVQGIGEVLLPIADNTEFCLVILMPRVGKSTKEAFDLFDAGVEHRRPDTDAMVASLAKGDVGAMACGLCNVFQTVQRNETTERLAAKLMENGALGASLSGSGAAVFGVFPDFLSAKRCQKRLAAPGLRAYVARKEPRGVEILNKK